MNVTLEAMTKPVGETTAEDFVAFCARVSNPSNQHNTETGPKLIKYLIEHQHWSPFEMVSVTMGIETSRAIAAQILRHRSFAFQEFSQRYANVTLETEYTEARRQSSKNRQSSVEPCSEAEKDWFTAAQDDVLDLAAHLYQEAIGMGIAREQARLLLPLMVKTNLYMTGSLRSWIHYVQLRTQPDTQAEHREVAEKCREILVAEFPTVAAALDWTTGRYTELDHLRSKPDAQ